MQDAGDGARLLERQATELLADLPPDEREGILMPDQLRRRKERELLVPVLATRDGGPSVPGDREMVFAEFDVCGRILAAAGLAGFERTVFVLHSQYGMTDTDIAGIIGRHVNSVAAYRKAAQRKIRQVVKATQPEGS